MAQIPKRIDVKNSYVPVDPNTWVPDTYTSDYANAPEVVESVVPYDGFNFMPTSYGYKSYFGLDQSFSDSLPDKTQHLVFFQLDTLENIAIALCESGIWIRRANAWSQVAVDSGEIPYEESEDVAPDVPIVFDPEDEAYESPVLTEDSIGTIPEYYLWTWAIIENSFYAYRQGSNKVWRINSKDVLETQSAFTAASVSTELFTDTESAYEASTLPIGLYQLYVSGTIYIRDAFGELQATETALLELPSIAIGTVGQHIQIILETLSVIPDELNVYYKRDTDEWKKKVLYPPNFADVNILFSAPGVEIEEFPPAAPVIPAGEVRAYYPNFLNMSAQLGIFRAGFQLAFWDSANAIACSNVNDPFDFEPSIETLASITTYSRIKGRIVHVVPEENNFVIYATGSIVRCVADVSSTQQWEPQSISQVAGIYYPGAVTTGQSEEEHYVLSSIGLLHITQGQAKVILPEVYDQIKEKEDEVVFLSCVAGRYLFFSSTKPLYAGIRFSRSLVPAESVYYRPSDGYEGCVNMFTYVQQARSRGKTVDGELAWLNYYISGRAGLFYSFDNVQEESSSRPYPVIYEYGNASEESMNKEPSVTIKQYSYISDVRDENEYTEESWKNLTDFLSNIPGMRQPGLGPYYPGANAGEIGNDIIGYDYVNPSLFIRERWDAIEARLKQSNGSLLNDNMIQPSLYFSYATARGRAFASNFEDKSKRGSFTATLAFQEASLLEGNPSYEILSARIKRILNNHFNDWKPALNIFGEAALSGGVSRDDHFVWAGSTYIPRQQVVPLGAKSLVVGSDIELEDDELFLGYMDQVTKPRWSFIPPQSLDGLDWVEGQQVHFLPAAYTQTHIACPNYLPAVVMEHHKYGLDMQVLETETHTDTIITEHTVTRPIANPVGSSGYSGAMYAAPGVSIPVDVEGAPNQPANTEPTYVDTPTQKITPAIYGKFKVYQYILGPWPKSATEVGGYINRPVLYLMADGGQGLGGLTNSDRKDLIAKAETLAKETLIRSWGFLPAWAEAYGGTVESYVLISKNPPHDLPLFDWMIRNASISEKSTLRTFNGFMKYVFDIQVELRPETVEEEIEDGEIINVISTPIDTVMEQDPETYTSYSTETKTTERIRARFFWRDMTPPEQAYAVVEHSPMIGYVYKKEPEMVYTPVGEPLYPWGEYEVGTVIPGNTLWVSIDPPFTVEYRENSTELEYSYLGYDVYTTFLAEEKELLGFQEYLGDPEEIENSLAPRTLDEDYALTGHLFSAEDNIINHLPALWDTVNLEKVQGAIDQYLVHLGGATWLNQHGSPAPVYPTFQEALVLDLHLNKWGRMKQVHSLIFNVSPINSNTGGIINPTTFKVEGGILDPTGVVYTFNDRPINSEIRWGKLGYYRLGYTDIEELKAYFRKTCTGSLVIEPSLDGVAVHPDLITETSYTATLQAHALQSLSARWYNIVLTGNYDIINMEFVGTRKSRR